MELWVLLWIVVILTVLGVIGVFFSFLNEVLFEPLYLWLTDVFWAWQAKRDRRRIETESRLEKERMDAAQKASGRHIFHCNLLYTPPFSGGFFVHGI